MVNRDAESSERSAVRHDTFELRSRFFCCPEKTKSILQTVSQKSVGIRKASCPPYDYDSTNLSEKP